MATPCSGSIASTHATARARASGCPARAGSISPFQHAAANLPNFAFSIGRIEAALRTGRTKVRPYVLHYTLGPLEVSMARVRAPRPSLMIAALAALALIGWAPARAATDQAIGYFDASGDVGSPAIAGATTYDAAAQTYTMVGSGTNMWAARDEFQFVWRKLSGDFILRTHAAFPGKGVEEHRKLGWIIRTSLDADSTYVDAAI